MKVHPGFDGKLPHCNKQFAAFFDRSQDVKVPQVDVRGDPAKGFQYRRGRAAALCGRRLPAAVPPLAS
jgi:hypothetical protein